MNDKTKAVKTFAQKQDEVRHDLTCQHRRKIPALTGIRGYAAMWVLLFHGVGVTWHHFTGEPVNSNQFPPISSGYLGVELFFILSGFILTLTYGDRVRSLSGIKTFAIGRVFRVLPLYWFSLTAFAIVTPLMHHRWLGGYVHSVPNLIWCFFLIQSWINKSTVWNTPGWSLSAEWLAYIAFPITMVFVDKLRRPVTLIGLAVAILTLLVARQHHRGLSSFNDAGRFGLERCACEFAIGSMVARLHQIGWIHARMGSVLLTLGLIFLLPPIFNSKYDFLAVVAFSFLVLSAGSHSRYAHALFGNRVAHFLGEISFSIYVLHWLLLELVFRFIPGTTPLVITLLAMPFAIIPLAWATWRWIEVPGQAMGRVLIARLRARDVVRAAAVISAAR